MKKYPKNQSNETEQMSYQAATPKGFERRICDIHLERVSEPRYAPNIVYKLPLMLTVLVAAMVTAASSLRKVERRTDQLVKRNGPWHGLLNRIADNTFGKLIPRLALNDLVKSLISMVKAEYRRGNIAPTQLPVATAAIDGKNVATLRWHDLCRVLELDPTTAKSKQVKTLLKKKFPNVQLCIPTDGMPYALARVHTVTLISSKAAVCIYQRPIEIRARAGRRAHHLPRSLAVRGGDALDRRRCPPRGPPAAGVVAPSSRCLCHFAAT
jgi:hypothetical protein